MLNWSFTNDVLIIRRNTSLGKKDCTFYTSILEICLQIGGQRFDDDMTAISRAVEEMYAAGNAALSYNTGTLLLEAVPFLRRLSWLPACKDIAMFLEGRTRMYERIILPALVCTMYTHFTRRPPD